MLRSNVFESRRFLAVAQQALLAGARLRRRLAVPGDGNAQSATVRTESPESTSKSVRAVSSVATTAVAAVAPRLVLRHNEAEACQRVLVAYFKATRQHAEAVRFFTVCGARTLSRTHTRTHARTHTMHRDRLFGLNCRRRFNRECTCGADPAVDDWWSACCCSASLLLLARYQ